MTSCLSLIAVIVTTLTCAVLVECIDDNCRFNFSYMDGPTGKFSSPGFPNPYPSLLRCTYFFDATPNGGVIIKFEAFELEHQVDKKDNRYDYIEVYTVDNKGFPTWLNRFCGGKIPQVITSPQSKLKILFYTDHWQNSASGFMGTYRFLGNDHQPFDHADKPCGENRITGESGFITSPRYPRPYPANVNCSWIINVPKKKHILIRIEKLDIGGRDPCRESKLLLYNGYAAKNVIATTKWCGQLSDYRMKDLQYVSNTNRTLLRFVSASANNYGNTGFKLMWMAISIPLANETCQGFQCKGDKHCHKDGTCDGPKYCISRSLVCDGVENCGPYDDSDERRCTREILIMAACIAVPSLIFLLIIFFVVYCYRARHVQKSTSQDQPLTHSQSQNTASHSHDSFTSNHHQMMVHTSFVDGACSMPLEPNEPDADPTDIDLQTTRGLFSDNSNSFRTHKKRPSYHMMQQNYEDGNNTIIARI